MEARLSEYTVYLDLRGNKEVILCLFLYSKTSVIHRYALISIVHELKVTQCFQLKTFIEKRLVIQSESIANRLMVLAHTQQFVTSTPP